MRRVTTIHFDRFHLPILLAFTICLGGCNRKGQPDNSGTKSSGGIVAAPSADAEEPDHPKVKGVTDLPQEHDPAKRPLVTSEPAATPFEWELQVLRDGYQKSGHREARWDADVERLFKLYAGSTHKQVVHFNELHRSAQAIRAAGCGDPLVHFLAVRYAPGAATVAQSAELVKIHDLILRSPYHPVFKFRAGLQAMEVSREVERMADRTLLQKWTVTCMEDFARDTNAPAEDVVDNAGVLLGYISGKRWHDFVLSDLSPIMERNFGNTDLWFCFRGRLEIEAAWEARGHSYADNVSAPGWQGYEQHLEQAEGFLSKAWQMNSNRVQTAYQMMRLELGQGKGTQRMETWFRRIMALDTNSYDGAHLMGYYLEPRWYGSEATCLMFGRSCVSSSKWGGQVPLVLANLHNSLANYYNLSNSPTYWHRPQVWADVKSSYEKFFKLNPEVVDIRHNYAYDAFTCGQYPVFLAQTKLFTKGTNYYYFGGEQKFKDMLQKAVAAGGKSP